MKFPFWQLQGVHANAHLFWHLLDIRKKTGPLMENSTEGYEAFYHRCLRGFRKGTRNVPKQIMESVYTSDRYGQKYTYSDVIG